MKKNVVYYSSESLDDLLGTIAIPHTYDTEIIITDEDSVSCIHRLAKTEDKLMCLNFASAKNPGGGFLGGAVAQEESLALSSSLYVGQLLAESFYQRHRNMKSCVYTDGMIFSPDVLVFRNNQGELVPYSKCSMITAAAVNTGVVKQREPDIAEHVPQWMLQRMDKLFALCIDKGLDTLILGAWGCGVFQNEPKVIAQLFHTLLEGKYKGSFKKIVFAIYSKNQKFIEPFYNIFGR